MRLRIGVALAVVLLCVGSIVVAQGQRRTEKFSGPLAGTGDVTGHCAEGNFDVLNDWTALVRGMDRYDNSGQFVQEVYQLRTIGEAVYYNSTNPDKSVLGSPAEHEVGRLVAGIFDSEFHYVIRVPGYGVIFAETGHIVYDTNTGQLLFNSGHNQMVAQDLAALCNYLR